MTEEQKDIYGAVLTQTSLVPQVDRAIENMAELMVQIKLLSRDHGNHKNLKIALANVEISMNFLKLIFDEHGDAEAIIHTKEERMRKTGTYE